MTKEIKVKKLVWEDFEGRTWVADLRHKHSTFVIRKLGDKYELNFDCRKFTYLKQAKAAAQEEWDAFIRSWVGE